MAETLAERIKGLLSALRPLELAVVDESSLHAGHPGARSGGGHFRVRLVSPEFAGLSRIQRHRLVYDCLADLMPSDIHALAMILLSPEEAASAGTHSPPRK
jgi:BolA family transcriptional regulator, general stress-responsive regulator